VARLAPLAGPVRRTPAGAEGAIIVHHDFDAPLPDEVLAFAASPQSSYLANR